MMKQVDDGLFAKIRRSQGVTVVYNARKQWSSRLLRSQTIPSSTTVRILTTTIVSGSTLVLCMFQTAQILFSSKEAMNSST